MLEILAQASIPTQPRECSLHHPPARNHHKTLGGRRPSGNFQPPPAGLLDPAHNALITPIRPEELHTAPAVVDSALDAGKEFSQEQFTARAIREARTVYHDQQQQPQDVHHDMPFAPFDLLVDIYSSLFPAFRRFDALTIHNCRTGLRRSPFLLADGFDQSCVEHVPQPAVAPAPVIPVHRLPRGKIVRQQPPRLSTTNDVENGIENLPVCPEARTAPSLHGRVEQSGQAVPLVIVQIRWVATSGLGFHPPRLSTPFTKRSLRTFQEIERQWALWMV